MVYQLNPYDLVFKVPFKLAHGSRTGTAAVFLLLSHAGKTGYGEATYPPYLDERPQDSITALEKLLPLLEPRHLENTVSISEFANQAGLSPFTRCLLVNAMFDLHARLKGRALSDLFEQPAGSTPGTTLTFTKNDPLNDTTKQQLAQNFSLIKLKLDGHNDLDFVREVQQTLQQPFCVDANQGWEKMDKQEVITLTSELKKLGCVLLEQPFERSQHAKHAWLKNENILPVYADEGLQDLRAFKEYGNCYDGVNIKLLKCGGIDRAYEMAIAVKTAGKKVIFGCMSESSCGCSTALALKGLADYLDLDGPWLINNDPFTGLEIKNGELRVRKMEGNGIGLIVTE